MKKSLLTGPLTRATAFALDAERLIYEESNLSGALNFARLARRELERVEELIRKELNLPPETKEVVR